MEHVGTGAAHRPPPEVLRRLALSQRLASRAVSHARVADAVLRRRTPKLLSASARLAPLAEAHVPGEPAGLARPVSTWARPADARTAAWEPPRVVQTEAA